MSSRNKTVGGIAIVTISSLFTTHAFPDISQKNLQVIREAFIDEYAKCAAYFVNVGVGDPTLNEEKTKEMSAVIMYKVVNYLHQTVGGSKEKIQADTVERTKEFSKAMTTVRNARSNGVDILHANYGDACLDAYDGGTTLYDRAMKVVEEKGDWN